MPNVYRVYVNRDGESLASFLLTKLGLLGVVKPGYVEVRLKPGMTEAVISGAVEEWISSVEVAPPMG